VVAEAAVVGGTDALEVVDELAREAEPEEHPATSTRAAKGAASRAAVIGDLQPPRLRSPSDCLQAARVPAAHRARSWEILRADRLNAAIVARAERPYVTPERRTVVLFVAAAVGLVASAAGDGAIGVNGRRIRAPGRCRSFCALITADMGRRSWLRPHTR
jgi:hypothetical protein